MKVCIVGSGISGFAVAHYLTDRPGIEVTILERDSLYGGRANVTADGEHCARLFLGDYHYLLGLFREIPGVGGTVLDSLRRCRRFAGRSDGTWVEIDHIYAFLARTRGLSIRDKVAITRSNWQALLVARHSAQSTNIFGSAWNWSTRSLVKAMATSRRERTTFAFPGATDRYLTEPWIELLRSRGVELRADTPVERLEPETDGVCVVTPAGREKFDAVVCTGFVHDAYALLDRSGVARPMDCRRHTHCKAFTIDLDPREPVLADSGVRIYAGGGITTVLQPDERRCVTLAAFPRSTAPDFVLDQVRRQLALEHEPVRVRTRNNLSRSEAVFVGEYVDPRRLEEPLRGKVYFAGSYTDNSYPLDSGEGACRSAFNTVGRMARDHREVVRRSALGLPSSAGSLRARRPGPHPNTPAHPRLDRGIRSAMTRIAALVTPLVADLVFDDPGDCTWPIAGPAVYVANHRSIFDVPGGVLTFRHLQTSPRLVIAQKYFHRGAFGKVLRAIGALPALRGCDATVNAGIAAIRGGDSVAIMPEGRITAPEDAATADYGRGAAEIAIATGAPIVPIGASGTNLVWGSSRAWPPLRWRRPRVRIAIGQPIYPAGLTAAELTEQIRDRVLRLENHIGPLVAHAIEKAIA
ncbi:FAD-dependent oxidoreductase [Kutzneria sp. NPDC051319]|uniref:FAD-dependent oxidoreductase n=1 Tax=Kutzneria sp. NPDC051319 TaxID=3155047 RepID=UPI003416F4F5